MSTKLSDESLPQLRKMLRAAERALGPEAVTVRILRRAIAAKRERLKRMKPKLLVPTLEARCHKGHVWTIAIPLYWFNPRKMLCPDCGRAAVFARWGGPADLVLAAPTKGNAAAEPRISTEGPGGARRRP